MDFAGGSFWILIVDLFGFLLWMDFNQNLSNLYTLCMLCWIRMDNFNILCRNQFALWDENSITLKQACLKHWHC